MGSLDTLTPDQRAVLDLVLARGRSYDDIAQLLAIDRAGVRARALAAFDEIGPDTGIAPESRALITDYLLGQLPERVAEQTRERLATSPYERAWARVLASELAPLASEPLPEIPDGSRAAAAVAAAPATTEPTGSAGSAGSAGPDTPRPKARPARERRTPRLSDRPSSRRGGVIMLVAGAVVVVALVVVLIAVLGSGSSSNHTTGNPAASGTTTAGGATTTTTSTNGSKAQVVGQTNLNPPTGTTSSAKGVAFVVKENTKNGTAYGIIIEAAHVPPNKNNSYAAWLYNSPTDAYRIGFVSPPVGKTGEFQVGSALPANAGHFKQLLVTIETQSSPKAPGTTLLEGAFKGVPAAS